MLVPSRSMADAMEIAAGTANSFTVGDPGGNAQLGPVASQAQWSKIQELIGKGIEEGATLVAGGPGRPDGLERGYYVRPTIFGRVRNDMTIARAEIFGPVLSIIGYESEDEAVALRRLQAVRQWTRTRRSRLRRLFGDEGDHRIWRALNSGRDMARLDRSAANRAGQFRP